MAILSSSISTTPTSSSGPVSTIRLAFSTAQPLARELYHRSPFEFPSTATDKSPTKVHASPFDRLAQSKDMSVLEAFTWIVIIAILIYFFLAFAMIGVSFLCRTCPAVLERLKDSLQSVRARLVALKSDKDHERCRNMEECMEEGRWPDRRGSRVCEETRLVMKKLGRNGWEKETYVVPRRRSH